MIVKCVKEEPGFVKGSLYMYNDRYGLAYPYSGEEMYYWWEYDGNPFRETGLLEKIRFFLFDFWKYI